MFRLPNERPNSRNSYEEWADYAEFSAIQKGKTSLLSLVKGQQLSSDEIEIEGVFDESDRSNDKVNEIADEIRRRKKKARNRYPFLLGNNDYTVSFITTNEQYGWVYKFLLLATRLNMKERRIQTLTNGTKIDGSEIFERLSASVAEVYFGERSNVEVFGTSEEGAFRQKLKTLILKIGEGGQIKQNVGYQAKDDKIDIVVWKPFSDSNRSQLLAFGQCKTGTTWLPKLTELDPVSFCSRWFTDQPVLSPVKLFYCAQYFPYEIWDSKSYNAGLIFDRFRILDYLPEKLSDNLFNEIKDWTQAAEKNIF